ncbi:DUF413 domain-containing protein [Candidatus Palibaumannia cicadellinicola]|uniref:Macrodomain Ori protein n=1 Tax=Baumannia cicadellinicola subsp. Homalodisca coagulata TaxID=374463 RepID=Q1LTR7_BAUCH|nr:DUF413 domain-containing protein [Candidatus Baumannia cicadellinicola]ABF14095.1 conserved hypothetical protein [Baumannia cicadellinicola str. Hc (Homalodisca coagulata)]MCJ7462369.1 DUF413 domain-containing protein [Candidatus Baumannia cicadellinicola]MCJ7462916.1 DUF413 domain-containing protein [Candidatus Baumannia cicadellinicola]
MADSFLSTNRYFDYKHYPRGFSRHGHFTIREAQLLERFGQAYNDLDCGKRKPITDDEHQFIAVCHGERLPSNDHEKVWLKYIAHTRRPKRFHTLSGGKPQMDVIEEYTDNED